MQIRKKEKKRKTPFLGALMGRVIRETKKKTQANPGLLDDSEKQIIIICTCSGHVQLCGYVWTGTKLSLFLVSA